MQAFRAIFAVFVLCLALKIVAAEKPSPDFASTVENTTTEIEEVIVSGKFDSLAQVKKAMDRAEDRVYDRYNEINQGTDYDIICRTEAPLGTRLKSKKCEPRYIDDARHEDTVEMFYRSQNGNVKLLAVAAIAAQRRSFLRTAMLQAAKNDPEMQHAIVEHALLKERYEKLLKERRGKRWAVWD
jgi:hypothetical protein